MPEIGQPLYLLAALGIAVPIAIHLWNKKPPRVVKVGSIRWFKGSSAPAAHRLHLKDIPLLFLRALLLLIFSLLLAGLLGTEETDEGDSFSLWLIQPELAHQFSEEEQDSLERENILLRLLVPGLPSLADSGDWRDRPVDTWAVFQEADRLPGAGDTIRVHSSLKQGSFSGSRPVLHRNFLFEEPEATQPTQKVGAGTIWLDNMAIGRQWIVEEGKISFALDTLYSEQQGKKEKLIQPDTFSVRFQVAEMYRQDARNIRLAFELLLAQMPDRVLKILPEADSSRANLLVWLKEDSLPQDWHQLAQQVLTGPDGQSRGNNRLLIIGEESGLFQLTARPVFGEMEQDKLQRLPLALMDLLPNTQLQAGAALLAMSATEAAPVVHSFSRNEWEGEKVSWHNWLWFLLMGLFLIERIWVYRK